MSFLRRLFAREPAEPAAPEEPAAPTATAGESGPPADEVEQTRERALLRAESERLSELQQRQLRYADRAWTPPAQGGERRADDESTGGDA